MDSQNDSKHGIAGSTLKIIAIVTMLIDHIAAVVMDGYLKSVGFYAHRTSMFQISPGAESAHVVIFWIDMVMRLIGRLGFPLFCFLLVEGFFYTRNRLKYAGRLFLFALISEIPFDLALENLKDFNIFTLHIVEFSYQNVFFTLLLGFLAIWAMEYFKKVYIKVPVLIIFIVIAEIMHTDYSGLGVATIAIMYMLHHKSEVSSMLSGCIVLTAGNLLEATSFIDVWLVSLYNGKRGLKLKYVFYLFYPVHLLVLYFILRAVCRA